MKRFFLVCLIFCISFSVFAEIKVNGLDLLPTEVQKEVTKVITDCLKTYEDGKLLEKGMANAGNILGGASAFRNGYGYKLLSFGVSVNAGVAADKDDLEDFVKNGNSKFLKEFAYKGDSYIGVGAQPFVVSAGLNLGKLLNMNRGLYLTLKGGYFDITIKKINFINHVFGAQLNYQLIKDIGFKFLRWNGLNVGCGLTYYNTKAEWEAKDIKGSSSFTVNSEKWQVDYTAALDAKYQIKNYVIPFELNTGFRLGIFDIFAGIGADFQFNGKGKLDANAKGNVKFDTSHTSDNCSPSASFSSKGGSLDKVNCKLNAGVGIDFGYVNLQIPVSVYLDDFALSASVLLNCTI